MAPSHPAARSTISRTDEVPAGGGGRTPRAPPDADEVRGALPSTGAHELQFGRDPGDANPEPHLRGESHSHGQGTEKINSFWPTLNHVVPVTSFLLIPARSVIETYRNFTVT